MKIEKFENIYTCLSEFTEKRAEIVNKCNTLANELADAIPENGKKMSKDQWLKKYQNTYHGINKIIEEYSKFLDLYLSFAHFLYKNKPAMPIIKAECWSILNLYENLMAIECEQENYRINYSQIASLVQFIHLYGKCRDKIHLCIYLKRNRVSKFS